MKLTGKELKLVEGITDILCDSCGCSCKTENGFEALKLEEHWGYDSNKDLQHWEAYLCEKCVDEKLPFINFKITKYFL